MKILHAIHSLDPKTGGPPRVVLDLADAQVAAGVSVGLLAADMTAEFVPEPILADRKPEAHAWSDVVEKLSAFVSQFDLIHCHGVWDRTIYTIAKAAQRIGKPYIIAPHGMLDPWSLSQKKWKKKLALFLGYRQMLDRAGGLHMLNADEAKLISNLRLRSKPFVLANGVHSQSHTTVALEPAFQQLLDESPYLLFLSRIHWKKGLDILIPAFAKVRERHPALRLLIAGPDDGEKSNLETLVRQTGLDDNVVFTGALYGPQKWAALGQATCFCLTSRQEGFSIAILEALSSSVPVLISQECHFPEVATAEAGRIVPLEPEKIALSLSELVANSEDRKSMGAAGRKLVSDYYTWPVIARKSVEIYGKILKF